MEKTMTDWHSVGVYSAVGKLPGNSGRIRILTADDHAIIRAGIAMLISKEPDMELVGEASTGREVVERYRALRPDITLMDLQMPDGDGIEAIKSIRRENDSARIIVLTTYAGDARAQRALQAGARGYLLKGMIRKELFDCIRAIHAGQKRIQGEVATQIAAHLGSDALTPRELDVLALVATGNSNREIAQELSISEETVKGHVKTILGKLGAADRTHAVLLAITRGFLQI
jgi:DNA-binding NarL/FixJ family response regulator